MNTVRICAWVSSAERQIIQERAAASGLSMSQYLSISALASMPDLKILQSLCLFTGEAHNLALLALEKQQAPAVFSPEEVNADLTELGQVLTQVIALITESLH